MTKQEEIDEIFGDISEEIKQEFLELANFLKN